MRGQKTYMPEQLDSLLRVEKRPVFMFIYTDWCTYCERMKQTTLKNKQIVQDLNQKYWYIDLDGESKRDIHFLGERYSFLQTGITTSTHQLAKKYGTIDGKLFYPVSVIINSDGTIRWRHSGFLSNKDLGKVLNRF